MNAKRGQRAPLVGWPHHVRRTLAAGGLALAVCILLLLVDAIGILPASATTRNPLRAAVAHAADSPTPATTVSPSPSPTNTSGTLQLVSPTSKQGPAGAHLTVSGSGFTGSNISLFASSGADCSAQQAVLTDVTLTNGAFTNATFIWPTSLPTGQYSICAPGMTFASGPPPFQDLTTSPPVLSLSTTTVQVGQTVTVTGHNFVGAQVITFTFSNKNVTTSRNDLNQSPDPSGNFSFDYTPDSNITGQVTIAASSQPDPGATQPLLQANASLLIQAAATATPAVSPTAKPVASPPVVATPAAPPATNSPSGLVIVFGVIVVLLLLAIIGAVAYFVLRNRGDGSGPGSYPGDPSAPGGYGEYAAPMRTTGPVPQYGVSSPGRFAGTGVFTGPGTLTGPGTGQYSGPPIGGVAQWNETEPQPAPNWQPRPMTGNRRDYDAPEYQDYQPPFEGEAPYQGGSSTAEGHAPPDPWGDASGNFGGPPSVGGAYGDTGPQSPDDANWNGNEDGWRGTNPSGGATRPENGRADW